MTRFWEGFATAFLLSAFAVGLFSLRVWIEARKIRNRDRTYIERELAEIARIHAR